MNNAKITPLFHNFANGALSGLCTGMIVGPISGLKVWVQTTEPPRNYLNITLYKNLFRMTPLFSFNTACVFGLEFSVNAHIGERYGTYAGLTMSGITGATFLTATDHMIYRKMVGQAPLTAIKSFRAAGIWTLWTGILPMCGRETIFTTSVMHLGPSIGQLFQNSSDEHSLFWSSVGRITSGVVTTTISQPFDCLAREMQKHFWRTNTRASFFSTLKKTPVNKLFRGTFPRVILSTAGGTLAGGLYEFFSRKNAKVEAHSEPSRSLQR